MSSLKLPEPIKVSKNITTQLDELERKGETIVTICGYANFEAIFYLHLIKKYKSKCVTKKTGPSDRGDPLLGMSIDIKVKLTKDEEEIMRVEFVNLAKTLTQCIKKGVENIIIPLNYYKGRTHTGHSNVLIYRRRTNVIEHFEPHGGAFKGNEKGQAVIEKRIDFFIRIFNAELKKGQLNNNVTYVAATSVCPYLKGLQSLEENSLLKRNQNEPGGYCSIWSMFFAELSLKNPDKSSEEILENIYNYLTTKENANNYLRKIIRGYSGYIVESINTYLKIFFKPTYTVLDVIGFTKKLIRKKYDTFRDVIKMLIDLESEILLDDDFDLEAELSRVKKLYNKATKGMTIEKQREERDGDKALRFLYYRKRILQNYEEYSNYGKISEPLADSPLELMQDTMTDHPVLIKRQKVQTQKVQTQKALEPLSNQAPKAVPKAKTQKRRLSPNTIQKRETLENEKLLAKIIKKYKIDMSTKAGQDELYKLVLSLKEK